MSKSARRRHRGKTVDTRLHRKTGRRKGEKTRIYLEAARKLMEGRT